MGAKGFKPSPISVTLMRNKIKNGTAKNNSSQNQGSVNTNLRPCRRKTRLKKPVSVLMVYGWQIEKMKQAGD
jgi:hypothetical protein